MNFVVLDTEGKPELSEIAIFNSQGQLIYEAFSEDHPNNSKNLPNLKSLKTLLMEFLNIVQDKKIVCHYANHDIEVIQNSFNKVGIIWTELEFECTYNLSKNYWEGLESYSLQYLSSYLNLRVNNRYFISSMAHSARYDAEFTYLLYRKLILEQLKNLPNPFSSSRVDTPFQKHPDYPNTYQVEFINLQSIINDIKLDSNHQSKGVVVIGKPGSGKTHLMMRLTQNRLLINRLLFIRQPNNPRAVIYHIYSRILESLVEMIGDSTQLDYLIVNSFRRILHNQNIISQKEKSILSALKNGGVNSLGAQGTARKREYWEHIEKRLNEWWTRCYSSAGFSPSILKGMIKYCSYTDPKLKDITTRWLAGNILSEEEAQRVGLPSWRDDLSLEAFSLEGISVLGKLSLLDEPLIIIFDQLEGLGLPHNREILLNFGEAIKEIFTHVPNSLIILNMFPDRWEQFKSYFDDSIFGRISQHQIYLKQPAEEELKAIINTKLQDFKFSLEQLFLPEDLADIFGQKSIRLVLNRASEYYKYRVHKIPLPIVKENLHELDNNEKLDQELRILKQQQEFFNKTLISLIQVVGEIASVDLTNLIQTIEPRVNKQKKEIPINVIEYLTYKKTLYEEQYSRLPIISDSDDIGKLKDIAQALNEIKPIRLTQYRLGRRVLPEHIVVETENKNYVMGFLQISTNTTSFTSRIKNFNELVILHKNDRFGLFRDERLTEIRGRVAQEEIRRLNNTENGKFIFLKKDDRIYLELVYQLIIDIQNRDLDVNLNSALNVLITQKEWYHWLLNMFGFKSIKAG